MSVTAAEIANATITADKLAADKLALTTMDKDDWRYKNWSHYVTVMPDVVAWTRAEYSRLLALRDRPRRPRRRKVKS